MLLLWEAHEILHPHTSLLCKDLDNILADRGINDLPVQLSDSVKNPIDVNSNLSKRPSKRLLLVLKSLVEVGQDEEEDYAKVY